MSVIDHADSCQLQREEDGIVGLGKEPFSQLSQGNTLIPHIHDSMVHSMVHLFTVNELSVYQRA